MKTLMIAFIMCLCLIPGKAQENVTNAERMRFALTSQLDDLILFKEKDVSEQTMYFYEIPSFYSKELIMLKISKFVNEYTDVIRMINWTKDPQQGSYNTILLFAPQEDIPLAEKITNAKQSDHLLVVYYEGEKTNILVLAALKE